MLYRLFLTLHNITQGRTKSCQVNIQCIAYTPPLKFQFQTHNTYFTLSTTHTFHTYTKTQNTKETAYTHFTKTQNTQYATQSTTTTSHKSNPQTPSSQEQKTTTPAQTISKLYQMPLRYPEINSK